MAKQGSGNFYKSIGKRSMDLMLAIPALILLSPCLAVVALLVRLTSPGPVLFRQHRLGRGGVPFSLVKFRTMYLGAPDLRNPDGSTFNADNDPRVTRLGHFLRRTSLDELPQLLNIIKGEMSLVGPRPDKLDQLEYYTLEERAKLQVKPGITGLAQISGRNSIAWEQRKRLDLEYVQRQSLGLDLLILAKTIPYVLFRRDVFVKAHQTPVNNDL